MKKVRFKLYPTKIGVIKTFRLSPDDEIGEIAVQCSGGTYYYDNLAKLCEQWEDYEEPKSGIESIRLNDMISGRHIVEIDFTKVEEAEKAVEKLEAWKRLNKCGFRFEGYNNRDRANGGDIVIYAHVDIPNNNLLEEAQPAMLEDLDLLFGGEE